MGYEGNPVLDKLPEHLKAYIAPQDYSRYTAMDQAVWRYTLRRNLAHLVKTTHASYPIGLRKAGISADSIPHLYGPQRILKDLEWAAVCVNTELPFSIAMEFLAHRVLVVGARARNLAHINRAAGADILLGAAGHAPMLSNPDYAQYLQQLGHLGTKALSTPADHQLHASRAHLKLLVQKRGTPQEIALAKARVEQVQHSITEASEMAQLQNLLGWTMEFGMMGTVKNPKLFGATLLSSVGNGKGYLQEIIMKQPLSIEAAHTHFNPLVKQDQLFVTPNFAHLGQVLEELAQTMALRTGGMAGLQKLLKSEALGTLELNTGLQISGHFEEVLEHQGKPIYVKTAGPTALANRERELIGHGTHRHPNGYGSPMGRLKGSITPIEDMGPRDLKAYGIYEGEQVKLEFEGGLHVSGRVASLTRNLQGKLMLVTFTDCTVLHQGKPLFLPEWGVFDMAIGSQIQSVFNGPADPNSFEPIPTIALDKEKEKGHPPQQTGLNQLYEWVREYRTGTNTMTSRHKIFKTLKEHHPEDWLLPIELYELARTQGQVEFALEIAKYLDQVKTANPLCGHLIDDGLTLVEKQLIRQV